MFFTEFNLRHKIDFNSPMINQCTCTCGFHRSVNEQIINKGTC